LDVMLASSAEEALGLARERVPDVITLDIILPGMDGWQFLDRAREIPALADVPVVIVSVVADESRGVSVGAWRVLHKPVLREELTQAIAELRQSDRSLNILVVDDDPQAVSYVSRHLESAGHRVIPAFGGREGIEA